MIKDKKAKVVEFNCRFGDPETQPLLYRLESDGFELFYLTASENLCSYNLKWKNKYSITVVMAATGYPGDYVKNRPIKDLLNFKREGVTVFHAGTSKNNNEINISGGRVLGITAEGDSLQDAISLVYDSISMIDSSNLVYRKDIGKKGLVKF